MATDKRTGLPIIRKGDDIFTAFDQIQDMIRERAFHIFSNRDSDEGDELSDWLKAESEVLTDIALSYDEDENQVTVEGDVTGFLPEEIEVKTKDGVLEIGGIHTEESRSEDKGVTKTTSKQMSFVRSFTLPDSVDTGKIDVHLTNGKFSAKIPKNSSLGL
jgi:HSP20 family molecular chaperone IbpA